MHNTKPFLFMITAGLILASSASAQTIDPAIIEMAVFGIDKNSGTMARYDFDTGQTKSIGTLRDAGNNPMTGVNASAYIPGFQNIFAFWTNPSDALSYLVYVNSETADATVVGQSLGAGEFSGATSALVPVEGSTTGETKWTVFALQHAEAEEDDTIPFDIIDDILVPSKPYYAKVTVLGAAISYGGYYNMPVTTKFQIGSVSYTPFGSFDKAVSGNVNDNHNPREYVFPNQYAAGTAVTTIGKSWKKKRWSYSGSKNGHWKKHLTVSGSTPTQQLVVLRDGDDVPQIPGFLNQANIVVFVEDYVDPTTNKIVLDENQAIFLFELGTTYMSSPAADYQDLVVLVTLAQDPTDFADSDDDDADEGDASRLLQVNHHTGGYVQLMTLDNIYDGLATGDGETFVANKGNLLYKIDTHSQTETLIGAIDYDNTFGLEFAGYTLMGFETDSDKLVPIDVLTGNTIGTPAALGMNDLGTIILMPLSDDPANNADSYD